MFKTKTLLSAAILGCSIALAGAVQAHSNHGIEHAVSSKTRTAKNVARDEFRNPQATLEFFEVADHHSVVEIWPGGGWYSEILAPYLNENGQYFAAHFDANSDVGYFVRSLAKYQEKLAAQPDVYGKVQLTAFYPPKSLNTVKGSADRVLTFRNVHNWMKAGFAPKAFAEFFQMLKPGGILGVVEHRAEPSTDLATMIKSGYVTEAQVMKLATDAGFTFIAKSQLNANVKDSADHESGVWALPPSLRNGDKDKEKYLAIGESDRMTLKFMKPKK